MVRTQIQIPDSLYASSKRLAERRQISLAELIRRGLEYMLSVSAKEAPPEAWTLPLAERLGGSDPFASPGWRAELHTAHLRVAEPGPVYEADVTSRRKKKR